MSSNKRNNNNNNDDDVKRNKEAKNILRPVLSAGVFVSFVNGIRRRGGEDLEDINELIRLSVVVVRMSLYGPTEKAAQGRDSLYIVGDFSIISLSNKSSGLSLLPNGIWPRRWNSTKTTQTRQQKDEKDKEMRFDNSPAQKRNICFVFFSLAENLSRSSRKSEQIDFWHCRF